MNKNYMSLTLTSMKTHPIIKFTFLLLLPFSFLFSYEYQLSVGAIFQNEAPFLKEWIDYHRLVGIEHFWLYDDSSTDNWQDVLAPYIEEGVVEVFDWSTARSTIKVWPQIQVEAYKNALKRSLNHSKWLALIDTDEFLVPMKEKTIQETIENHFAKADAIYICWLNFGTSSLSLKEGDSLLSKLTQCSHKSHPSNSTGKSIVQPEKVDVDAVWYVHHCPLPADCLYLNGSAQTMPRTSNHDLFSTSHQSAYLRINHYFFRDERFFRQVKVARKIKRNVPLTELQLFYKDCKKDKDTRILELIQDK